LDGSKKQHEFFVHFRHSKLKIIITPNGSLETETRDVIDCLKDDDDDQFDDLRCHFSFPVSTSLEEIYKVIYRAVGEENVERVREVDSFWDDFLGVVKRALWDYFDGDYQYSLEAEMKMLKRKKRKLQDYILENHNHVLYTNMKKHKSEK
jgi:RNAse (barnase) inhibitor barstar